jgi:DNA-directed RNA polymerase subunit RPC12/RpoP
MSKPDQSHNPDVNPQWAPKVAYRIYVCDECGAETQIQTNHTGHVAAAKCAGRCRDIFNPDTAREIVMWHPHRPHTYLREAYA